MEAKKCQICFRLEDKFNLHMSGDVRLGQLDGEGYVTIFIGGSWKITKDAIVMVRGNKMGTLYMTSNIKDMVALANAEVDTNLWHCRLGHMSDKGMKVMLKKGKQAGLKSIDVGLYEDCILGK